MCSAPADPYLAVWLPAAGATEIQAEQACAVASHTLVVLIFQGSGNLLIY